MKKKMTRLQKIKSTGGLPASLLYLFEPSDVSDNFTTPKQFLDLARKKKDPMTPEEAEALVKRWAGASLSVEIFDETEKNMKAWGC